VRIRVAHLYPDYLNIYADRGNIAVLERRSSLRGHSIDVTGVEPGDRLDASSFDLLYVGGGQDREQALIAPDLAARADTIATAVSGGTVLLAVCGGYQLLGRGYRGRDGSRLPGAGLFPLETVAGGRRLIGNVLLEADLDGVPTRVAGFENHAGRTLLDAGARPLGRVLAGYGNDGESGFEGCRVGTAIGTYLHGPLLPRNPVLADWLLSRALEHAGGDGSLEPLGDELERLAHTVAASRAARGHHSLTAGVRTRLASVAGGRAARRRGRPT
jgi:lipid II isoglutaminyl synthase (glutamine-hydrolysing)